AVCVVIDTETDDRLSQDRVIARARGFRSMLKVPLLQENAAIGVINVTQRDARVVQRRRDRPPPDLRPPGRHRDRERAPVYRVTGEEPRADRSAYSSQRGARSADGDE